MHPKHESQKGTLLAAYLFAMMLLVLLLAAITLHLTGEGFAPH